MEELTDTLIENKPFDHLNEHLVQEFDWLLDTIEWRWQKEFKKNTQEQPAVPSIKEGDSRYKELLIHFNLTEQHRLILVLSLAPFFIPSELTKAVTSSTAYDPVSYGLRKTMYSNQFFPTGTTAMFLLAGKKFKDKMLAYKSLTQHPLLQAEKSLLYLGKVEEQEPLTHAFLSVDMGVIDYLSGINDLASLLTKP